MSSAGCCCGKCTFGARSTDTYFGGCIHTQSEVLKLRIPRPAGTGQKARFEVTAQAGQSCSCVGTCLTATYCQKSPCIEVNYTHEGGGTSRTYGWHYEIPADQLLWPPCDNACCGYNNQSSGPDDAQCCQGSADSMCGNIAYRNFTGGRLSGFAVRAISNGNIPEISTDNTAENCEYGDTWWWLQGVSNASSSHLYRRYTTDSSGNPSAAGTTTLERTLACVTHKEKWWERTYNSLSQTDNPSASTIDNAAASCRTPKWWVFACSGVPLYQWEIYDAYNVHGTITENEMKEIFKCVGSGAPGGSQQTPFSSTAMSGLDKLEKAGVISTEDLGRVDGKIIKKSMNYVTNIGNTVTEDQYFYARNGGWTYACHDYASSMDFDNQWPLRPPLRQKSVGPCTFGPSTDQCYTAAPIPGNLCTCQTINSSGGGCCCGSIPSGCAPGPTTSCGGTAYTTTCTIDTIVGNCKGCWIQFARYDLSSHDSNLRYGCNKNDAYLCRTPGSSDTCTFGDLPDDIHHQIPSEVSSAIRNDPNTSAACCGGEGTHTYNSNQCPSASPNAADCAAADEETDQHDDGWAPEVCD